MKYRLISAAVGISILGSTGIASVVHASPVNTNSVNTTSIVTYNQSNENFRAELDRMLSAGEINSDQHKKMMELYNAGGDFKTGLDDSVAKGVINNFQHTKILEFFKKFPKPNNAPNSNAPGSVHIQSVPQSSAPTQLIPQYK